MELIIWPNKIEPDKPTDIEKKNNSQKIFDRATNLKKCLQPEIGA